MEDHENKSSAHQDDAYNTRPLPRRERDKQRPDTERVRAVVGLITMNFALLDESISELVTYAFLPRGDLAEALFARERIDRRIEVLRTLAETSVFTDEQAKLIPKLMVRVSELKALRNRYVHSVLGRHPSPRSSQLINAVRDKKTGRTKIENITLEQLEKLADDIQALMREIRELSASVYSAFMQRVFADGESESEA